MKADHLMTAHPRCEIQPNTELTELDGDLLVALWHGYWELAPREERRGFSADRGKARFRENFEQRVVRHRPDEEPWAIQRIALGQRPAGPSTGSFPAGQGVAYWRGCDASYFAIRSGNVGTK